MKVAVYRDLGLEVLMHKRLQHRPAPSQELLSLAVATRKGYPRNPYTGSESRSDFRPCISNGK